MDEFVVICPHCGTEIIISKLNCGIFRHAVLKATGAQVDPHASKASCDDLIKNNLIYGCGKPFRILASAEGKDKTVAFVAQPCDYI